MLIKDVTAVGVDSCVFAKLEVCLPANWRWLNVQWLQDFYSVSRSYIGDGIGINNHSVGSNPVCYVKWRKE